MTSPLPRPLQAHTSYTGYAFNLCPYTNLGPRSVEQLGVVYGRVNNDAVKNIKALIAE